MEPLSIVADEVALEGLDGITVPSLWIRLEDIKPAFPLKLDDSTKDFIWKSLIGNADLRFYQLPKERDDVVLFDRFKDIDPETGIEAVHQSSTLRKDVYPIHITLENKKGLQGSCVLLKERTDVTQHVRSKSFTPLLNLQEALEKYGRKLVVVASQVVRFRTLIGNDSDPDLILNDDSFCVLERVGRARWQGELQRDLHGSAFKIDARKLHYMRKSLVKHGLVTMQSHVTRMSSGQQQHSILLLLKRFHVNRRTKYDILMEHVSNLLQQTPSHFATIVAVKEQLPSVNERSFKRIFQYMRAAKLVEFCQYPLEDLEPSAGPCINKKGCKVLVRCVRLLKPYTKKGVTEDYDDDDEDEDYDSRALPSEGRTMETDILSQAYRLVLSCGTKGITQRDVGTRMRVGKLECRMICRRLERDSLIKGFMVDVGRQRTTRFISHKCVGVSNQLQMVAKEQERKKLLYSEPPAAKEKTKPQAAKKSKKAGGGGKEGAKKAGEASDGDAGEAGRKPGAEKKTAGGKSVKSNPEIPVAQTTPAESAGSDCETSTRSDSASSPRAEQAGAEEGESSAASPPLPGRTDSNAADNRPENDIVLVKEVCKPRGRLKAKRSLARSHETYRLLRRRNVIIEAVRSFRIIEGLFPLQKIINEEEKHDGINSKCCRKTVLRLVDSLSREGLLKVYKTTVIQDGITKNVEMVVHPSIQAGDEIVSRVIEQVRFRISSSYSAVRLQHAEEKAREQAKEAESGNTSLSKEMNKDKTTKLEDFKPTTVRGLGKTFGFQPKMHRLRLVHNFLWYLIYGHPGIRDPADVRSSAAEASTGAKDADPDGKLPKESSAAAAAAANEGQTPPSETAASGSADQQAADSPQTDVTASSVYSVEESWKKFMPPVRVHSDFGSGWARVGDLLLCLPLSIFIQVIQINYEVDGLEEYLNDPVKQHHLIRALPARMKRQLLYKRKYIFSFHENLQKLVYMGLLQFGPMEKFKEKDQVFVYLMRNASIVDTTSAEPHYWLVTESPDKPFERRRYTFNTAEDVENYWFDLMCVCLNTALGVIRSKRNTTDEETTAPSFVHERNVFVGLAYLLKGRREVCEDGSIPGDGRGAGGLHSEFFAHLKRNWLWTNHLLAVKATSSGLEAQENKIRLKSLLTRNALRIALRAGGTTTPRYVTAKRPLIAETIELDIEPASRNQQVVGGKKQKRKRVRKEVVKAPRKKKKVEPKKRTPAHDEADHRALKLMTRQRVYWSLQEDSLMMLCSVATHLLNSKLKRPYVPYCVVRDLLQAEFVISMDKTSLSVGRRTRYILKNPQTLLNYRICLAEVYQDKPLMKLLEAKKPAHPENPDDCGKSFSEYTKLLRQKFSAVLLSTRNVVVPDTKRQLFARYKVSAIENSKRLSWKDTLNCLDDIHAIVLHNLIQSTLAMTNCQMKSSRSFQTFHMYSRYNQDLLCQVFVQCRKMGLVNRRRIHQPFGPKKNRALPILPMSYQLSQSYYRCFSWRFPPLLCTDSFRFLRSLINNGTGDSRPLVEFHHETEKRSESGEEVTEKKKKKKQQQQQQGQRTEDGGKETSDAALQTDAATAKEEPADRSNAEGEAKEDLAEPPDVSDMQRFCMDSPGGACVVSLSLMSLGLLSVSISIPKQMVVVDSNLVDNDVVKSMAALEEEDDDEEDAEECEGRKKLEVKAHQASHTNYLMMRGYCAPGIVKIRNLNTNDNVVVESCIMRLQLRDTPAHRLFDTESSTSLDLTKCGPSLLPSVLTDFTCSPSSPSPDAARECDARLIERRGYTAQDLDAVAQLRRSLDAAGEKGVAACDLHRTLRHLKEPQSGRTRGLQQYLQELQEEGQVVRVGGSGVRWVLTQHADPWLLTVNSKQWSQSRFSSDRLPFLEKDHNIPFMRKRARREVRPPSEEPPAKTMAMDERGGGEDGGGEDGGGEDGRDSADLSADATRKEPSEEQQQDQEQQQEQQQHQDQEQQLEQQQDQEQQLEQQQDQEQQQHQDQEQQLEQQQDQEHQQDHEQQMEQPQDQEQQQEQQQDQEQQMEQPQEQQQDQEQQMEQQQDQEQRLELADVGSGDKSLAEESGKPTQPEEEGGRAPEGRRVGTRDRRPRRTSRGDGEEEELSHPTSAAGDHKAEDVSFVSRPWRMVDGNLNRQVCKGMLEAMLYHIMSRPGLTRQALLEHYKDVLQPMAVLDLMQALLDMGCVTEKTQVKAPKRWLFTPPASAEEEVPVEEVYYEPTISCCLRLSQVLPNERHWNLTVP